ncbi:LysR family transcriptional regulator [Tardiphaga sp.]|uniref:LysR family transcriptional regulator n=1 Tax=Tardiphaga sp. TaxID=1926292 RepID=UPI0037D9EBB0
MENINHFNLRSFDLNLLVAFDALFKDRSVTKAAARLKIQQPAMSHNLSTLRLLMDDELFVRVGNLMQPTAKAEVLAEQVGAVLGQMQKIVLSTERFDPAVSDKIFRIGFSCEELLLMPDLSGQLTDTAPGVKLISHRVLASKIGRELDEGLIDLAIGCYPPSPDRYRHKVLFEQHLACCYSPALIDIDDKIDCETYLESRHVFVSQDDDIQGCIGSMLTGAGHRLDIVMGVPDYLTALATAAKAPLVVTMPMQIAERYASVFGLVCQTAPVKLALPAISLIWSTKTDNEPSAAWLREQIIEVSAAHGTRRAQAA